MVAMKKTIFLLSIPALFCACSKTLEPNVEKADDNIIEIRMAADAGDKDIPGTKMTLSLNEGCYDFLWSKGDQISLINKTGESYGEALDLVSEPGSNKGDFEGKVYRSSDGWYAVYPYSYENKIHTKDILSLDWYGTNQLAVDGTPASNKILMVGQCSSQNPSIKFKNVLAYFKFQIDFACAEVVIEPNNDTALGASTLEVMVGEDGIPTVCGWTLPNSGDSSLHLRPASGTIIQPGTYYLAVIPQELPDGFSMQFEAEDGTKYYKSTAKSVELKRNRILNLGTMSPQNLSTDGKFSGAGTETNPYKISSKEHLMVLSDLVYFEKDGHYANAYYKQECDIDCGGDVLEPIGFHSISVSDKRFKGTYDGQGYKISNFAPGYLKSSGGLFGGVEDATFKNIVMQPRSFSKRLYSGNTTYYGILAGYATGNVVIDNCKVIGDSNVTFRIKADFVSLGAMVGATTGSLTITNCSNSMDFGITELELVPSFESTNIGGMVGRAYKITDNKESIVFDSCRNTGDIWTGGNGETYAGGIIGRIYEESSVGDYQLKMTNCVNSGSIAAVTNDNEADAAAGGLVGSNRSDGYKGHEPYLYNCLNKGDILCIGDDGYGGGIMGFVYSGDTKFYLCVNTGNVTDKYGDADLSKYDVSLGAIAGDNFDKLFHNPGYFYWCYWSNDAAMPIVCGEPNYSHASNCGYKAALSYDDMNKLRGNVPACDYDIAYWVQNQDGLDLVLE